MVPTNKEQLHKLVSAKTIEAYEELAPQVVQHAPQYFADHADIYEIMQEFDGVLFSGPVKLGSI